MAILGCGSDNYTSTTPIVKVPQGGIAMLENTVIIGITPSLVLWFLCRVSLTSSRLQVPHGEAERNENLVVNERMVENTSRIV